MIDLAEITCLADIPRVQARLRPDAPALWFEGKAISYAELDALSNRCANALIARGLKPGDRVSTLTKNNADFVILWFGCAKARVSLAPVNWRLAPPEVAFIVRDAGSKLLFVGHDFADSVDLFVGQLSELHGLVQFEAGHDRWPGFRDFIAGFPETDPLLAAQPDDDVIQLYTSGTTGLPKGVQLTETNHQALFRYGIESGWARYDAGKSILVVMPLFHVAGTATVTLGLLQGLRCVITREVVAGEIIGLMNDEAIAYAFLAPTIINLLLQTPSVEKADFSKLERILYGASPIAEDVLKKAQAVFGAQFVQLYGLTETIGCATILTAADHDEGRLRACGRPGVGFEVRVATNGQEVAQGEVGEIQVRSSGIMKGYWNRPEATAEAIDAEGWFKTGDAGYVCPEGYLHIHDRVKDMIVSGGENVYPAEVENALFGHPAIADAAVIGVPDDKWGEAVKAIVVLKPGETADAASIIAHARGKIAGYKVPKSVDFVAVLPRNPSGKVLRRELREPFWKGRERMVG